VTVKCCGRLEDGTEIDRYDDLKLVLGDSDFIDGEAAILMQILPELLITFWFVVAQACKIRSEIWVASSP